MFRRIGDAMLKSTALVSAVQTNGKESVGTAFLLDQEGHLCTCYHVTGSAKDGDALLIQPNGQYVACDFDVLYRSRPKDLVILHLRKPPSFIKQYPIFLANMSKDDFGLGKSVATCGYPKPRILKRPYVTSGIVSSITYPKGGKPYEFQMNLTALPGNSGGLVVTQEGYLIGMVVATTAINGQFLPYTTALHVSEIFATASTVGLDFGWIP